MTSGEKIDFLVQEIKDAVDSEIMRKDIETVAHKEKGFKSAAFRMRRWTTNLEKVFKNFRKATIEFAAEMPKQR